MDMRAPKPAIAIIIPGGVGTGRNNIGVPALERIIISLSRDFHITVFQLYPVNHDYKPNDFDLIEVYSGNRFLKFLKFFPVFRKAHRVMNFQAVHGFWAFPCGLLAVLSGKIFNIRSLISLQGGDAISIPEIRYGQLQTRFSRRLVMWALHRTDELISPTRYLIHNLQMFGFRRTNIRYIPLGIDTAVFSFRSKPIGRPVRFVHIGNLTPVKDQVTLLKAFEIISSEIDARLTIIGEGELEKKLKLMVTQLKLQDKIVFHGLLAYDSLPELYHQEDILLHTSLSEGHPIVVQEAMSCGVVVCGTRVGLLYDLPECCMAVPVKDYQSLARATLQLIADHQRLETLRIQARKWAIEHSIEWTLREFKQCYAL
jgi:glycosyltransferase involved in cell wall biosynthesis